MFGITVIVEESRNKHSGYTQINWICKACGHIISLPQQQHFNYCLHCGRRIISRKTGRRHIVWKRYMK